MLSRYPHVTRQLLCPWRHEPERRAVLAGVILGLGSARQVPARTVNQADHSTEPAAAAADRRQRRGAPQQPALPGTGIADCGYAAADQDVVHDPQAVLAAGQPKRGPHPVRTVFIPLTGTSNRESRALPAEAYP